jgi:HSP20 family molecular chaperone IbpA
MRQNESKLMVKHYLLGKDNALTLKGVSAVQFEYGQSLEFNTEIARKAFGVGSSTEAYLSGSVDLAHRENFSKLPKTISFDRAVRGVTGLFLIEKPKSATAQPTAKPLRPSRPITSYSFYEDGAKYVKVTLNLPGAENLKPEQISLTMKRRQLEVKIDSHNNENYIFRVTRTHNKYVPGEISHVLKKDKIILKLTKEDPKDHVFSLYKQKMVGDIPSGDEDA